MGLLNCSHEPFRIVPAFVAVASKRADRLVSTTCCKSTADSKKSNGWHWNDLDYLYTTSSSIMIPSRCCWMKSLRSTSVGLTTIISPLFVSRRPNWNWKYLVWTVYAFLKPVSIDTKFKHELVYITTSNRPPSFTREHSTKKSAVSYVCH